MRIATLLVFGLLTFASPAMSQNGSCEQAGACPVDGPLRNVVEMVHASGDTLWAGPFLVYTSDNGNSWFQVHGQDGDINVFQPPFGPNSSIYSFDTYRNTHIAGLGYRDPLTADNVQNAGGFALSQDRGDSWRYIFPHLDEQSDTLQVYGINVLPALPLMTPQNAAPYDVAVDHTTGDIWLAGALAGPRRLRYDPATEEYENRFERVVLPPDTLLSIRPDEEVFFPIVRQIPGAFIFSRNFLAYSVLVDEAGTVWFGTEGGLNRSRQEDVYFFQDLETGEIFDERGWQRFPFDGSIPGLVGGTVVVLAEQKIGDEDFPVGSPENPRNPIWIAAWRPTGTVSAPGEQYGIMVTRDGGESFETVMLGERVNDFAFCEERFHHCDTGTIWAAADDGLFTSKDDGRTWQATRYFEDSTHPGRFVKPGATVRGVTTSTEALWVGTTDGLLRSTDGGASWTIFRVDVPTSPDTPTDRTPDVDVYAYPNPFNPRNDGIIRIRYDDSPNRIRIFDFGLNLVRALENPAPVEQAWDGLDATGARVSNGVYFYAVEGSGSTRWGKIIVLE